MRRSFKIVKMDLTQHEKTVGNHGHERSHERSLYRAAGQVLQLPDSGNMLQVPTMAGCSYPDSSEYPCQVFPAGPHVGRYGTKNVQKKVRKNVSICCINPLKHGLVPRRIHRQKWFFEFRVWLIRSLVIVMRVDAGMTQKLWLG